MITQERLKEVLSYDPTTGAFMWASKFTQTIIVGEVAGCIDGNGYRHIDIDGKTYKAHRLAWLYMEGYFPESDVDHENRIKHDNRWCNLRHVSRSCNMRNRGILSNNTSGVNGVHWRVARGRWIASIRVDKHLFHLGSFENLQDAVKARWEAEIKFDFPNCNTTSSAHLYLKEQELI